jgi:hypothetical protein
MPIDRRLLRLIIGCDVFAEDIESDFADIEGNAGGDAGIELEVGDADEMHNHTGECYGASGALLYSLTLPHQPSSLQSSWRRTLMVFSQRDFLLVGSLKVGDLDNLLRQSAKSPLLAMRMVGVSWAGA